MTSDCNSSHSGRTDKGQCVVSVLRRWPLASEEVRLASCDLSCPGNMLK